MAANLGIAKQHYYSEDVRERVIHLRIAHSLSYRDISKALGGHPCPKTVSDIVNKYAATGETQAPQGQKGLRKKRKFDAIAAETLVDLIQENDQLLQSELALLLGDLLGNRWETYEISRALAELGYVRKRVFTRAYEARPEAQAAYRQLVDLLGLSAEHYIFFDEVATDDRALNRAYAWVQAGELSKSHSLFVRGRRFTTIAAMSIAGVLARRTIEGAATKDIFTEFFADDVVPLLQPFPERGSAVVFDNCTIHDKELLQSACDVLGVVCLFLPPYSPIYNPIEKLFGAVKAWLKSNRAFVCQVPPQVAIDAAFESISPESCENWVRGVYFYDK